MRELRSYKVTVSPEEVLTALKTVFPENLSIQAIPRDAVGKIVGNFGLEINWTRDFSPHSRPASQRRPQFPLLAPGGLSVPHMAEDDLDQGGS